jgi:hypothetical protein
MKRHSLNFWIDIVSFVIFFGLVLTGLLIYYVLPPCGNCSGASTACEFEATLWGMGRHSYGTIHFYLSLATIALMSLHVALHWSWVCQSCCRLLGWKSLPPDRQNLYGTVFLSALILGTIALLYLAKLQVS